MEQKFREVNLKKTDEALTEQIAEKRGIKVTRIREMMRHSCWRQKQFADLTGKHITTINNLMILGKKKDGQYVKALNVCNPFPNKDSMGSNYIVRDDLSMEILLKSLE